MNDKSIEKQIFDAICEVTNFNSESEPIFALSERDFIFSKEGKMLDENYNPNKKIFEEFKV